MNNEQYEEPEFGSPEGGVISPLLTNIYLNYLDTIMGEAVLTLANSSVMRTTWSYFVTRRYMLWKLELTMNTEKSRLLSVWDDTEGGLVCQSPILLTGSKRPWD